jgi:3-dehydroquinate dehydratase type I
MAMPNRVAATLAPRDTDQALALLAELAPRIGYAEVRLDLMESCDMARQLVGSPTPLIITCRPQREGGRFAGPEPERLAILRQAARLGCAYIDLEWDSVAELPSLALGRTGAMVSRHWYDRMPADLWSHYTALREHADVVKLVGLARRPADLGPILDLLWRAESPVVAIAMGAEGMVSRLLAPCATSCLLTYGAATADSTTAAGQLSLHEMTDVYHLQAAGPHTLIHLHLCADAGRAAAVAARNASETPGVLLHVPLVIAPDDIAALAPALTALPRLRLIADSELQAALDRVTR